jgi:potassium channel subfamily K, other eukaryote
MVLSPLEKILRIVVPTTTLGRALVMPYAIIGIISLGLVISSIRTIVVERGHIRKKLVSAMLKKSKKRQQLAERKLRRYPPYPRFK